MKKLSISAKKSRKAICSVCSKRFESKELVEKHKTEAHIPTILRYYCTACNQSHQSLSDIKAHQLWHKLSKTPYQCPLCDASIANNYAYSRHLREHTLPTPIELLVLDRECPLCKKTFLTNFFYNTHPCARRTRQCGGCSRLLSSEVAYMRHAPHCAKIYLNHSKHIMPEAANHEAQMRIKNENDLEAEDNAQLSIAYTKQAEMQPVVVLERLGSPLLRAASAGLIAERVSSKNYLKRVDQLLKNTMNTLVSIKHEPEVHIDDTGPPLASEEPESDPNDEPACDNFHADAGYDDSDEDAANGSANTAAVPTANPPAKSVKQEVIDDSYEKQLMPSTDGAQIKQEPLKLKLKITKNHGQLNSSIVDDDNEVQSKSAKKKKKRKHKERSKDSEGSDKATASATAPEESPIEESVETAGSAIMTIKQERLDDDFASDFAPREEFEPQSTVMTSIPMLQLECNYSEENQKLPEEQEDVKPNRLELDRIMQITHIASGVVMAEEAMPLENAVEAVPQEDRVVETPANATKKIATKSTARKSTGGAMQRDVASSSNSLPATLEQLPQIVAVESGAAVPFNSIVIKPEPLNRGYADEEQEWTDQNETEAEQHDQNKSNEINHNDSRDDESAYINSLDLSNVIIKQEKDLHISDVNINGSEADSMHYNGLHESEDSEEDENVDGDYDDGSASSADEADENMDTYEDREERIYREIELQPLDEQDAVKSTAPETENESVMPTKPAEPQPEIKTDSSPELEGTPMETQNEAQEDQPRSEMQTVEPQKTTITALEEQAVVETQSESEIYSVEPSEMAQQSESNQERQQNQSQPPEEPQMPNEAESQPHTHSETAFNFVITSVCSQAEQQSLAANDEQFKDINPDPSHLDAGEKSAINEEHSTSPVVTLSAPKDSETLAQPVYASSSNYNCAEEQQNVLNHELSATVQEAQHETESEPDSSTTAVCTEALAEDAHSANEETENRINEQQQQQLEQVQQEPMQQQQQPPRLALDDDSNINEIAENNNNANIERELNDDANVAQENPME